MTRCRSRSCCNRLCEILEEKGSTRLSKLKAVWSAWSPYTLVLPKSRKASASVEDDDEGEGRRHGSLTQILRSRDWRSEAIRGAQRRPPTDDRCSPAQRVGRIMIRPCKSQTGRGNRGSREVTGESRSALRTCCVMGATPRRFRSIEPQFGLHNGGSVRHGQARSGG